MPDLYSPQLRDSKAEETRAKTYRFGDDGHHPPSSRIIDHGLVKCMFFNLGLQDAHHSPSGDTGEFFQTFMILVTVAF